MSSLKRTLSYSAALDAPRSKKSRRGDPVKAAIASVQRQVSSLNRMVELKSHRSWFNNTGVGVGGYLLELSQVPEGDTSQSRTGLHIVPTLLDMRWQFESETADASSDFRLMIVQAKQGIPTGANFPAAFQGIAPADLARYNVLYDQLVTVNNEHVGDGTGGVVAVTVYKTFHKTIKLNRKIWFNDGGSTAVNGGIYLYVVTTSTIVNHPDVEFFDATMYFKDA